MRTDKSGPAFPCPEFLSPSTPGMTLRQWYAGLAMQGMLSNVAQWRTTGETTLILSGTAATRIADNAFFIADAMLRGYQ